MIVIVPSVRVIADVSAADVAAAQVPEVEVDDTVPLSAVFAKVLLSVPVLLLTYCELDAVA